MKHLRLPVLALLIAMLLLAATPVAAATDSEVSGIDCWMSSVIDLFVDSISLAFSGSEPIFDTPPSDPIATTDASPGIVPTNAGSDPTSESESGHQIDPNG